MGARAPFEKVVAQHGARVLRVCRAILDPGDADDAWSETFLAALKAYPALPQDANVKGWLVTIAHRKAIDVTRARRRRRPVDETEVRLGPNPAEGHALLQALRTLPAKQRLAVTYHHLAGLPHAEVAALLGGSAAAARRASADGIATLRMLYGTKKERPR